MTDRELLELAAKAAGVPGEYLGGDIVSSEGGALSFWNPLTGDGDALRLAVKLRLYIDHAPRFVVVTDNPSTILFNEQGTDAAATRRAIVRAAAAIGEQQCRT